MLARVPGPTHNAGNLLDVVVTDEHSTTLAQQPNPVDAGFSDHKLVVSVLDVGRSKPVVRHYTFRNIKIVDPAVFSAALRLKLVCTTPSDDVSLFADQLNQSITDVLDELAPLKSGSKRGGKCSSCWLSDAAIVSTRKRRRLERRWARTRSETDRIAYRAACRQANDEINKLRQSFYRQRFEESIGDQKAKWKVVHELLHSDQHTDMEPSLYPVQSFLPGKAEADR